MTRTALGDDDPAALLSSWLTGRQHETDHHLSGRRRRPDRVVRRDGRECGGQGRELSHRRTTGRAGRLRPPGPPAALASTGLDPGVLGRGAGRRAARGRLRPDRNPGDRGGASSRGATGGVPAPWGMPLGPAAPTGWADLAAAVRAQPDRAALRWPAAGAVWLRAGEGTVTGVELVTAARAVLDHSKAVEGGRLATTEQPKTASGVVAMTVAPALARGSVVLADGVDVMRISRAGAEPGRLSARLTCRNGPCSPGGRLSPLPCVSLVTDDNGAYGLTWADCSEGNYGPDSTWRREVRGLHATTCDLARLRFGPASGRACGAQAPVAQGGSRSAGTGPPPDRRSGRGRNVRGEAPRGQHRHDSRSSIRNRSWRLPTSR